MDNACGFCGGFFCIWHPVDLSNLRNFHRFTWRGGEGKVETGKKNYFLALKQEAVCGGSVLSNETDNECMKIQDLKKF